MLQSSRALFPAARPGPAVSAATPTRDKHTDHRYGTDESDLARWRRGHELKCIKSTAARTKQLCGDRQTLDQLLARSKGSVTIHLKKES